MAERKELHIKVPEGTTPSFANATQVTVSDDAVILQFAYLRPKGAAGQLVSEVILSPKHAIQFSRSLDETIKKHFTRHLDKGTS